MHGLAQTPTGKSTARIVPDAISTVVFMLVILFIIALAIGNTFTTTTWYAWNRGLWMLLPFTMQMTLVLTLGCVLAGAQLLSRQSHDCACRRANRAR